MKKRVIWIVLTCLMATSLVLASCASSTTTTSTTSTTTYIYYNVNTNFDLETNIHDNDDETNYNNYCCHRKLVGQTWKPQYGGTMTLRINRDIVQFDPAQGDTVTGISVGVVGTTVGERLDIGPGSI